MFVTVAAGGPVLRPPMRTSNGLCYTAATFGRGLLGSSGGTIAGQSLAGFPYRTVEHCATTPQGTCFSSTERRRQLRDPLGAANGAFGLPTVRGHPVIGIKPGGAVHVKAVGDATAGWKVQGDDPPVVSRSRQRVHVRGPPVEWANQRDALSLRRKYGREPKGHGDETIHVSPLLRRPVTATQVLLRDEQPLRVNPRVAEAMGGCLLKIAHPRADPWERPASRKGLNRGG